MTLPTEHMPEIVKQIQLLKAKTVRLYERSREQGQAKEMLVRINAQLQDGSLNPEVADEMHRRESARVRDLGEDSPSGRTLKRQIAELEAGIADRVLTAEEFLAYVPQICQTRRCHDRRGTQHWFCWDVKLHYLDLDFASLAKYWSGCDGYDNAAKVRYWDGASEEELAKCSDFMQAAHQAYAEISEENLWAWSVEDACLTFDDGGHPQGGVVSDELGDICRESDAVFGFDGRSGGWLVLAKFHDWTTCLDDVDYEEWIQDGMTDETRLQLMRLLCNVYLMTEGTLPEQKVQHMAAFRLFEDWAEQKVSEIWEGRFTDLLNSKPTWTLDTGEQVCQSDNPQNAPRSVTVWYHVAPAGRVTVGFGEAEAQHLLEHVGGHLFSRELVCNGDERHYTREET